MTGENFLRWQTNPGKNEMKEAGKYENEKGGWIGDVWAKILKKLANVKGEQTRREAEWTKTWAKW